MKDQAELRKAVARGARVLHVGHFIAGNLTAYFDPGTFKDEHDALLPEPVIGIDDHRFLANHELIYELSPGLDLIFEMVSSEMTGTIKKVIGFGRNHSLDPEATLAIIVACLSRQIVALHGLEGQQG